MFSSNFTKFFGVLSIALVFLPACRFWQTAETEAPDSTPFVSEDLRSEIPFATKEPEIFQVEILTIVNNEANTTFAAASGGKRRFDYNYNTKNQISLLQTADKSRLILPGRKIYTESNFVAGDSLMTDGLTDFLTTGLMNDKPEARFVNLGTEGNLTKYRAIFEAGGNSQSEALIFVDAQIGLPVRQEFYTVAATGEQKTLTMTIELKNLKLEAPDDLFEIPKDFRSVSRKEFQAAMQSLKEK